MTEFQEPQPMGTPLFSSRREQIVVFVLVCVGIVSLTYGLFFLIDFLPEKPETVTDTLSPVSEISEAIAIESITPRDKVAPTYIDAYPVSIIFDSLDKEIPILNPESQTVSALDTALLSGAVRHPDSADFRNEGTIFLFGHSSYLPSVINKNFQAFNGIQKLVWGDVIRLRSSDTEYIYRVDRVYMAEASDAEVKIEHGKAKLALVTCNSFGSKDDRYVVEATLVEQKPL